MSFMYPKPDWVFVDATRINAGTGTFFSPFQAFETAYAAVPSGGTVWSLQPGTHTTGGGMVLNKPMTIQAPLGGVTLLP